MVIRLSHPYHIPCNGMHRETVSDYYPLSRDEVEMLLLLVYQLDRWDDHWNFEANSVQMRLIQGIAGITCPHETDGAVQKREYRLAARYMQWLESEEPVTGKLVDDICACYWTLEEYHASQRHVPVSRRRRG